MQHGEGTLCLPLAPTPSSRSLARSLSLCSSLSLSLVRSFPLPVVHRSTDHLPLQFLAAFDISDARGSRPGEITEPSRTDWNLRSRPSESKARNRRVAIALRSFRPTFLRSSIRSEYDETYDIYARPRSRLVRADSRVPDCISVCTFARFQRTPRSTMLDSCSTDAHRSANQIGFAVHYKLIQSCRTLPGKSRKENSRKTRSNDARGNAVVAYRSSAETI